MAVVEIVSGLVGAGIGAAAAIVTPLIAERLQRRGADRERQVSDRTRQLDALAAIRIGSREAIADTESAIKILFATSSNDVISFRAVDVAGDLCNLAHRAARDIGQEVMADLNLTATELNELIHEIWRIIDEVRRRQPLLPASLRDRYDAESRRALEDKLALAVQIREQLKILLRAKVEQLGGVFPDSLVSNAVVVESVEIRRRPIGSEGT